MRLKETLRRDRETLRRLDRKARLQMIWDYYKLPIIGFLCVIVLTALTLGIRISASGTVLYAVFINAEDGGEKAELDALLSRGGVELNGRTIDVAANYTLRYDDPSGSYADTVHVLAALFGIGDLDVFAADEPVFTAYADKDAFVDLGLFIGKDDLAGMQLYTRAGDGVQTRAERIDGIRLEAPSPLHEAGYYSGPVVIGAAANARNLDESIAFLKQIVKEAKAGRQEAEKLKPESQEAGR